MMLRKKHRRTSSDCVRDEKHPKLHVSTTDGVPSPKSPNIAAPALSPTIPREISYPKAVDDEKMQEFTNSKQCTIQKMLNEAVSQYQMMKSEYDKNPTELNQSHIDAKEKVIRRLKSQLSQTSVSTQEASASGTSVKENERILSCMENSASSLEDKEDSSSSSCGLPLHAYQMPRNIKLGGKLKGRGSIVSSSLSRSHSDSYKQRQEYLDSLKPSASSDDFRSIVENSAIGKCRQNSVLSRSHSKSQGGTSDGNSDADQLHPLAEEHSSSSLDVTGSTNSIPGHRNSQHLSTILSFDDYFSGEGEKCESYNDFSRFDDIRGKPAHLAIFLHYLITNSDPAPLLFYLVTEGFSQGSGKDVKRWSYELYTTFLYEKAPLKFVVDLSILDILHELLSSKSDKEEKLSPLFEQVRCEALSLVNEYFGDFRSKLILGLGTFYGEQELKNVNSSASAINVVENHLWGQFVALAPEENDRSSAICSALLTYFRSIGLTQANSYVDRFTPFLYKDKAKFSVFSKSVKKGTMHTSDHNLQQQQYTTITTCNLCQHLIGGVGFQGYTCSKCEQNFHKNCMGGIRERCSGKRVDRSKTTPNILRKKISVKGSSLKQGGIDTDANLPRAVSLISLRESSGSKSHKFFWDRDRDIPKDASLTANAKLARDDSLKSGFESMSALVGVTTGTKLSQHESGRGKSPEPPEDDQNEFCDPVNKLFSNYHIPALSKNSQLEISSDSDFEAETEVPQLESYIPKECLKKMKPKEKKRQNIINELFHTERNHVRNMKVMHHVIFLRMNNEFQKDFVHLLFPNLEELIKVHNELNQEFKEKKKQSENFVVQEFADILVCHFTGEKSDRFKKVCAVFCEKQSQALEKLKVRQRKDQKLSSFLQEVANNPLCRRFELKDLLPTAMQRLTKYPLFISSLLKYTSDNEECKKLELALEGSRSVLEHVDRAVQHYENHLKLVAMQRRLDKKAIENATSSVLAQYRNLDLTRHSLVFDGPLTWRISRDRLIPLHVVLLDDILLLLQKQDDRLVLKCQSMYIAAGKVDTRMTHSPIIKLVNLLIKPVATDPSAFFLVSQLTNPGPQIYDLIAGSKDEKDKWCRCITAALDAYKLVNPEAWRIAQIKNASKQLVHHRPSAPTSPVDEPSPVNAQDATTIPGPADEVHDETSVTEDGNDFQYLLERQLSDRTMTGVFPDDISDDTDVDDDEDAATGLAKLKKVDEKIHKLLEEKEDLVNSLSCPKRSIPGTDEDDQKVSCDANRAVQSMLDELDVLLNVFVSEDESLSYNEAALTAHRLDFEDTLASQSLSILPSQMKCDEAWDALPKTGLTSSRSSSQLSSPVKSSLVIENETHSTDEPRDKSSEMPNSSSEEPIQITYRENRAESFDSCSFDKDQKNKSAEDDYTAMQKTKLLSTCLKIQAELRLLLEATIDRNSNIPALFSQADSCDSGIRQNLETSETSLPEVGVLNIQESDHSSAPETGILEDMATFNEERRTQNIDTSDNSDVPECSQSTRIS